MKRRLIATLAATTLVWLAGCAGNGGGGQQQALVDRATLTLRDMLATPNRNDRVGALRHARAVMICPQIFKAAFLLGGSGGNCVLVARDGSGSWSSPAFYVVGSGSAGFQAGIQDAEVIMMILTERGLSAVMDSQFKFGGDAALTFATVGAGVEGSTTAALRADIVAYSQSRGLFAGIALDGSILTSDTAWNRSYYGQDLAARQIVMQMQANNAGASPLRQALTEYGARSVVPRYGASAYTPRQSYGSNDSYGSGGPVTDSVPYTPDNRGSVSEQALPPVR